MIHLFVPKVFDVLVIIITFYSSLQQLSSYTMAI
jgi:hypothetical protein